MAGNRRSSPLIHKTPFRFRHLLKPKMILVIALFLSWNIRNSVTVAMYHHQHSFSANGISPHNQHSHHPTTNIRLRMPTSLAGMPDSMLPLGGAGITLPDEAPIVGPGIRIPSAPLSSSSSQISQSFPLESSAQVDVMTGPRRKKDCGEPSIATRGLLGPTMKRSYFAFTQDEVDQKVRDDEYRETGERRKRDLQHQLLQKRNGNGAAGGGGGESQDSPLPWTCETRYEWKDMGTDHYPRFVRTAECKSKLCFNGFFRCRPRRYKTKVLKRVTTADSTSCEDDDVSLPETLRSNWKFITVTINLCCDCTGRIPGNAEV